MPFFFADNIADHALRQVLEDRERVNLLLRLALHDVLREVGTYQNAAVLVVALDRRRAGPEGDFRNPFQWHASAASGLYRELRDRAQILTGRFRQLHADRNLPIGQGEFRSILLDLAHGRDTDRLAERGGGHAQFGSDVRARLDDQFGPVDVGIDPRSDQRVEPLHLFDQSGSGFFQQIGIRSGKHDRHVAARTEAARLRLETDPRIGDFGQHRRQITLEFDRGLFPVLFQRNVERRIAFTHAFQRTLNFGLFVKQRGHAVGNQFGACKRGARDHVDLHAAVVIVDRRLELSRRVHEQQDGQQE